MEKKPRDGTEISVMLIDVSRGKLFQRKISNRNLFAYSVERNSNTHRYPRALSHGVVGSRRANKWGET